MAPLLSRLRWRLRMLRLALTVKPVMGGSPEDDPDPKDPDPKDPDPKDDPKPDDPKDDPGKVDKDDDWQTKARKHERTAKAERRKREQLEKDLRDREDANKSEQQKAVDKAKEEGRQEALTEAEKDRRRDRLEVSVTRLAAKGIELGEDDEKKTVRFADTEDALLHIERALANGDADEEDIFDGEGKVNTDALSTALGELLERKPHLASGERKEPAGDADTRKGDAADKDLERMTPEDHAKRKYPANK